MASRSVFFKMYGHWATMSLDHRDLLVVPFRALPSEMDPDASAKKVDEERRFIRDILKLSREEIANNPKACALMRRMGSDLVVNMFACNFRVDGVINGDVSEANYLNARIYDRLSVKSMSEKLEDTKVIIMSSMLSQKEYGACLTKFKERLGMSGQEDLYVLVNVSMSPFIAPINFEQVLADIFRRVAEEEVEVRPQSVIIGLGLHLIKRTGFCRAEQIRICSKGICSSRQRPDQLGSHAMFWYDQSATTVHSKWGIIEW
jgi:hypothetical protein